MIRLAKIRNTYTTRKILAWGIGGTTTIAATSLAAYTASDSGAGLRRELRFWSKVAPIVFDYYITVSSSSPLVKFNQWYYHPHENDTEITKRQRRNDLLRQLHEKHAPTILNVMLELKGLYVKLGQVLSVTTLPVPEPYRVLFRTLQSDVPGYETFDDVIKPTLESQFRTFNLSHLFSHIDPIPCGAASIGQAHRARLPSGESVVIKVQYPDASWQIPADIKCVGDFLSLCVLFSVVDETAARISYDEFSRQFLSELDYARERRNLARVYESSGDERAPYRRRNVVVPKVYEELCSDKVITMSYLPGSTIESEAKRRLASLGIDTTKSFGSIVRDAARNAAEKPEETETTGALARRVTHDPNVPTTATTSTKNPPSSSWKLSASLTFGKLFGVDAILSAVRVTRRLLLRSQAVTVRLLRLLPRVVVPTTWQSWAEDHDTAAIQAEQWGLTESWMDALFDVHGHQIFNLGLFNADPHLIDDERNDSDGTSHSTTMTPRTPSTKLGLIDYGQCKTLTPTEQVKIARLLLSIAENQSDETIAAAFRQLGIVTQNDSTSFLADFGRLMFGPLLPQHFDHGWHRRLHERDRVMYFPKELSMVYRMSLLLRGLGMSLQVNCSVGEKWRGHARECVERYPDIVRWLEKENEEGKDVECSDDGDGLVVAMEQTRRGNVWPLQES